ncbi:MAG: extracellular solute-binding protein [Chloroflexi bacterium]|nr:extracellular solute-binding protein [Chloroflexota bacterium]
MLSRRAFLASTVVLAAGCGGLEFPFTVLGTPQETALTWVTRALPGFTTPLGLSPHQERLQWVVRKLTENSESSYSPERGRYSLTLRYVNWEDFPELEMLPAWLEELGADLVTLWPGQARVLGEQGVLIPLDRFGEGNGSDFEKEFYESVLNPFRASGALYALPVGANPLMLNFDVDYFAQVGVAPSNSSWDWDVLVENALRLTQREEDGTVSRWGLEAHGHFIWWALWQNEAEMVEPLTSQCRLQDPAAIEALEFFRGLIHTHRVSPAALGTDLARLIYDPAGSPPAMLYNSSPPGPPHYSYRRVELTVGKVRSVPVSTDPGIAIVAQTAKPEAAYTALRGLVHTMRPYVNVPSEREAVARLGQIRSDLQPKEVTAVQNSMENGRTEPQDAAQNRAMYTLVEALVRGDDVASAVNHACSVLYENR